MSGIRTLLTKLGVDQGIKIDPDEFDVLGLSEEDEVSLADPLPGKAAGAVEIFLAAPSTQVQATVDSDGFVWSPIMYENQWALRPDGKGGKKRVPLKIVAGHSTNQRREIGLADIKAAFDDKAIESVTVPETHENRPTENHGYVEKLKIGKVKLDDGKTVTALMGGMDIKIPETKRKMELGAVAGRSAGLLYDYARTDTGKVYPVALEHVCLTSRQWLRGMPRFGRKLSMLSNDVPIASLVLSDDGPSDDEYVAALDAEPDDTDFLADTASVWPEEESPEWLRDQVNAILDGKRAEQQAKSQSIPMYVDDIPCYRCCEAKPTAALISDGYGEGANSWIAPIAIINGEVELSDSTKWQAIERVWVADTEDTPADPAPALSDDVVELTNLEVSQALREARAKGETLDLAQLSAKKRKKLPPHAFAIPEKRMFPIHDQSHARNALARAAGTQYEARVKAAVKKKHPKISQSSSSSTSSSNYNEPPRGGGKMAGNDTSALQLSEEAKAHFKKLEDDLLAANERNTQLSQKVDRLVGTASVNEADSFIRKLKAMGLDEEHGFSGLLNEVHQIMLADDGGVAIQSDHFSDEKSNPTGELTVSDAMRRVFGALETAEGVSIKLGEIITPPSETTEGGSLDAGKPPKGDENLDEGEMDDDALLALHEKEHPGILKKAGLTLSFNGKEGE